MMRRLMGYIFVIVVALGWGSFVWALSITTPKEGAVFHPGDTITVVAVAAAGESIHTVSFGVGNAVFNFVKGPPFRFTTTIPTTTVGKVQVSASGLTNADPNVPVVDAPPVLIEVVLPSTTVLQGIRQERRKLFLTKVPAGTQGAQFSETEQLRIKGQYSDGIERNVSSTSTGTVYTSSDEKVATVDNEGLVTAQGPGTAQITIKNGQHELTIKAIVDEEKKAKP